MAQLMTWLPKQWRLGWMAKDFNNLCADLEKRGSEVGSKATDAFLEMLFDLMGLVFVIFPNQRKNIEGFEGRYQFQSRDGKISVGVQFKNGAVHVEKDRISAPNVTVVFKDDHALWNLLLSPNPNILDAILNQDIVPDGNLNYIYKLAYMAKHMQMHLLA